VRLSFFAIFPAPVFFRASVFKVRTSVVVQERRFPFFTGSLHVGVTIRALAASRMRGKLIFI
jgi:hypothetical protein